MTVCVDLDAVEWTTPPVAVGSQAGAGAMAPAEPAEARLPLRPLLALVGSGTFALWTSLTCFVC